MLRFPLLHATRSIKSAIEGLIRDGGLDLLESENGYVTESTTVLDAGAMVELGRRVAAGLKAGDVLHLSGTLGAGKTTFVKGVAKGLGISATVLSPSFTIIAQYDGSIPLVHVDLYRITSDDELEMTGIDDYLDGGSVMAIEWPARAPDAIPPPDYVVSITIRDDGSRVVTISSQDEVTNRSDG